MPTALSDADFVADGDLSYKITAIINKSPLKYEFQKNVLTSVFNVVLVVVALVIGLGDFALGIPDKDLFRTFSFSGELRVFSVADALRRDAVVVAGRDEGDFAAVVVVDEEVPFTFDFIDKVVGFGALVN